MPGSPAAAVDNRLRNIVSWSLRFLGTRVSWCIDRLRQVAEELASKFLPHQRLSWAWNTALTAVALPLQLVPTPVTKVVKAVFKAASSLPSRTHKLLLDATNSLITRRALYHKQLAAMDSPCSDCASPLLMAGAHAPSDASSTQLIALAVVAGVAILGTLLCILMRKCQRRRQVALLFPFATGKQQSTVTDEVMAMLQGRTRSSLPTVRTVKMPETVGRGQVQALLKRHVVAREIRTALGWLGCCCPPSLTVVVAVPAQSSGRADVRDRDGNYLKIIALLEELHGNVGRLMLLCLCSELTGCVCGFVVTQRTTVASACAWPCMVWWQTRETRLPCEVASLIGRFTLWRLLLTKSQPRSYDDTKSC